MPHTRIPWRIAAWLAAAVVTGNTAVAQEAPNYDEAKVPRYELPDALLGLDGKRVRGAADWTGWRRAEVLRMFEQNVYGRSPERPARMTFEMLERESGVLGDIATRKQWRVWFGAKKSGPHLDLLVYQPTAASNPVPVFLAMNFKGNHTVADDPGVLLAQSWVPDGKGVKDHRATEQARGEQASRWPLAMILGRGYAAATYYYGDVEPDHPDGWKEGVRGALQGEGNVHRGGDWGAISAWAWGLSRAMDCLVTDPDLDAHRVAVMGHSRLGKAALWAGARDERFALVISNESGEGGAALARRCFGETTALIQRSFPHWFCANFRRFAGHEDQLPVDQHELLALIAPRPLYVASAEDDRWADPRGEFLAALAAEPVYALFGKKGLGVSEMPAVDTPVGNQIGYHMRRGGHGVTNYDWEQYLSFADRHFQMPRKPGKN